MGIEGVGAEGADLNPKTSEVLRALQQQESRKSVRAALDVIDGKVFVGCEIDGGPYLITSDREAILVDQAHEHGLRVPAVDLSRSRFSPGAVAGFLNGERTVNVTELHSRIVRYLRGFICLRDPREYDLLALYVMGTYVFPIFQYFPYLHIVGEKGSGKTVLMEVMSGLCFNSAMTVNASAAVIYRLIEDRRASLFIDEADTLQEADREKHSTIMQVLNQGFVKSGTVLRCGGENYQAVLEFSAFSPKVLAGIKDLDNVLNDRAIAVRMVRKRKDEQAERYTGSPEQLEVQSGLRDDLYIFGLTSGREIAGLYHGPISGIRGLDGLDNRQADLWTPLVVIAGLVDPEGKMLVPAMQALAAQKLKARSGEDNLENPTVKHLRILWRMLDELPPYREDKGKAIYPNDKVLGYFNRALEGGQYSQHFLTKALGALDVHVETVWVRGRSQKCYSISRDSIQDLVARYLEDGETVSVSPIVREEEPSNTNPDKGF